MRLTEIIKVNGKEYVNIKGTKGIYANAERKGAPASNAIVRLAAYEYAEENGLLVRLPCKVGDTAWFYLYEDRYYLRKGIYRGTITELKSVQRLNQSPLVLAVVEFEYPDPWYGGEMKRSEMHCSLSAYGSWVRFYLSRENAEAALKGETEDV